MARDDKTRRQNQFLEQYSKFLVIQDACEAMDPPLSRSTFESWRRSDRKFLEKMAEADLKVSDDIKRMGLKCAGIIPWTLDERSRGVPRTVSAPVLNKLLGKVQEFKDHDPPPPVINFPVVGVDAKTLAKLIAPDPQRDLETKTAAPVPIDPIKALEDGPAPGENG